MTLTIADFDFDALTILNDTIYNTEDIRSLLIKVKETVTSKTFKADVAAHKVWFYESRFEPECLRIGYYNPKGEHQRVFNISSQWQGNPRLGIINPNKLQANPLMALASQAMENASGELIVPADTVVALVTGILRLFRTNTQIHTYDCLAEHWSWMTKFQVRYGKTPGKKALLAVKRDRLDRKLDQTLAAIRRLRLDIGCHEQGLVEAKEDLALAEERLVKCESDLAKFDRVSKP